MAESIRAHQVISIATDRKDQRFELRSCKFFLKYSKMFLKISGDTIYNKIEFSIRLFIYSTDYIFITVIKANKKIHIDWQINK